MGWKIPVFADLSLCRLRPGFALLALPAVVWAAQAPVQAQDYYPPRYPGIPPAMLAPPPGYQPGFSPNLPPNLPSGLCQNANQAFAEEAEALIVQGIDAERAKYAPGAPPLVEDQELTRIAQRRSCDMGHGADFSHRDAKGRFIAGDMVRAKFGPYGSIGENIMMMGGNMLGRRPYGPEEFARIAVKGWMESPGHRENILNPSYDTSGIGVAFVGDQAFATQVFRGPPSRISRRETRSEVPED